MNSVEYTVITPAIRDTKPSFDPEYRITPLDGTQTWIAYEVNIPGNMGISGIGESALGALVDLLTKLTNRKVN